VLYFPCHVGLLEAYSLSICLCYRGLDEGIFFFLSVFCLIGLFNWLGGFLCVAIDLCVLEEVVFCFFGGFGFEH